MPNIYTSKNVENGLTFDDLITKLLAYKPDQWGYTEQDFNNIKTDFNVSENSLYNLPLGNYKLKNMPNSPFNSEFVNVRIFTWNNNKKAICNIGGVIEYGTTLTEANPNGPSWQELSEGKRQDIDAAIIVVGDTVPTGTRNNFPLWVDTSKAFITGEIFLRFHGDDGVWHSYTVTDSMDMSVYDKNGIKKDPYKEVMNEVEKFIGDYAEIIMHINNELKLIHINASDKEYFDTYLLTSENVANYFEEGGEFYNEMVKYVKSTITTTTGLDTSTVNANLQVLKQNLTQHYDNHVTEVDVEYWDSKADADHTHNLDPNVTVDASDIDFGDSTIPDAAIPDSVKERPILITSLSVLKNVDTSLLDSTYHNGNMLYIANENDVYDFYKIVDNSYFNTDDYMEGVKKFSVEIGEVNFADAIKVPSDGYTLADYGITDALAKGDLEKYEKSYEDELKCEIVPSNLTAEAVGDADLYMKVNQSSDKSEINVYISINDSANFEDDVYNFKYVRKEIIAQLRSMPADNDWSSICYGKDKFVSIIDYSNIFAYSSDGITWTQGTLPSAQRWSSVCYGKDKFVTVVGGSNTSNIFAYSSDGITWTQGTLPSSQRWYSVCYGKDKFVTAGYNSTVCVYSSDGITWTTATLPVASYWESICYGKDKFVINGNSSSLTVYSSDGITWTQGGTMPEKQNWRSICYGKDKFVSVASSGSYTVAYSSDGITWTRGNMPLNRSWYSVCYGKDKYVAVASDTDKFAYSSDGITWTQGTLPSSQRWSSVCYGKDKFVAVAHYSNICLSFIFSSPASIIGDIYQFRIPNKSGVDYSFEPGNLVKDYDNTPINTIDETYTDWNGNKFHIHIYWDPERGLVFASPNMVSKLITADYINKNELSETAVQEHVNKFKEIRNKLS